MRYETYEFILRNKEKFRYNSATGATNDGSTDPGADKVNPNNFLAPILGGSKLTQWLTIVVLVLLIVYLFKQDFFTKTMAVITAS